jgi:hypothetical protein
VIGLVSCSSQKLERPAIARRLYSSPLFQKSLEYAERRCMAVYILSAAHGLVGVDDFIEPYNRRLGTKAERAQWGKRVVGELFQRDVKHHEDLFVLAGEDYAGPLRSALRDVNWSGAMYEPLRGMQVGERLAFLNAELERMPLQLPAPNQSPAERATAQWMTPRPESKTPFACSFCGKSEHVAKRMISGPRVFICDECVELCVDILDSKEAA